MEQTYETLVERWTVEQRDRIAQAKGKNLDDERSGPCLLNSFLAGTLREVGHTQMVLLADKGFPIAPGVETVDLALLDDLPTILDVIRAISVDLSYDRILITDEMQAISPKRVTALKSLGKPFEVYAHVEFKHLAAHARLAIRTGDTTPYANCLLVCG